MIPQEMLKHLVKLVTPSAGASQVLQKPENTLDEVIFESDVDGVHYYLVRSRPKSRRHIILSEREQEIARLVAQGLPNKCIGQKLNISHWTVSTYIRRIFGKLGVTSRTAMITQLLEENLLHSECRFSTPQGRHSENI